MSKSHVACFKCGQFARPRPNNIGSNELVMLAFALGCPNIPDEVNPLGISGQMLCPMSQAHHTQQKVKAA